MTAYRVDMFTLATACGGRRMARSAPAGLTEARVDAQVTVPDGDELLAMAQGLTPSARHWRGMVRLTTRRWELLAASATFEAWVIGWPPGGTIALHDHGDSAAAVAVAGGQLVETTVTDDGDGTVSTSARTMTAGAGWSMASHHVHDVVNNGSHPAVSVHVYAPRLTSMTHYRLDGGVLRTDRTVHYRLGDIVP
jgi:hypothetical protein